MLPYPLIGAALGSRLKELDGNVAVYLRLSQLLRGDEERSHAGWVIFVPFSFYYFELLLLVWLYAKRSFYGRRKIPGLCYFFP